MLLGKGVPPKNISCHELRGIVAVGLLRRVPHPAIENLDDRAPSFSPGSASPLRRDGASGIGAKVREGLEGSSVAQPRDDAGIAIFAPVGLGVPWWGDLVVIPAQNLFFTLFMANELGEGQVRFLSEDGEPVGHEIGIVGGYDFTI